MSSFPLFFLSGALFPVNDQLPAWLQGVVLLNPLTYTVDAVRGSLLGLNVFPFYINCAVITSFAVLMILVGSALFSRMK